MAKMGAPTKYDPNFCLRVDDYLKANQDEWTEFHKTRGEKSDSYERVLRVHLPTRYGFAEFLGVGLASLDNWEKLYPSFLGALQKIEQEQKRRLLEGGLEGSYNPVIAKLVLSANHGMAEKTDVTSGGEKITGITYTLVHGAEHKDTGGV